MSKAAGIAGFVLPKAPTFLAQTASAAGGAVSAGVVVVQGQEAAGTSMGVGLGK